MTNEPTNNLTITNTGVYELTYKTNAAVTDGGNLTFNLRTGTQNIPGTTYAVTTTGTNVATYEGTIIANLNAGDEVNMVVTADDTETATINNSSLTIKQLN